MHNIYPYTKPGQMFTFLPGMTDRDFRIQRLLPPPALLRQHLNQGLRLKILNWFIDQGPIIKFLSQPMSINMSWHYIFGAWWRYRRKSAEQKYSLSVSTSVLCYMYYYILIYFFKIVLKSRSQSRKQILVIF